MTSPTPQEILLNSLATYRLTRLVVQDEITTELRAKAYEQINKLPDPLANKLSYLLSCPWCVSIWAAGVLLVLRKTSPELAEFVTGLLAASAVAGVISERV